ncbi:kinase-like domain-containing protein [Lenzites betulinus]|nr:kinase-like domain-containing protein [Lenzites betulinus]
MFLGEEAYVLDSSEVFWSNLSIFLETRGYTLRPRYRHGWVPNIKPFGAPLSELEDGIVLPLSHSHMIDARRASDGLLVYLKAIPTSSKELEICRHLSSEALRYDPWNHSVPLLDVIQHPSDPGISIIVMPFLRKIDDPPFETIEDVLECGEQILDGLLFLHEHHVAHRDCHAFNIMMDAAALYPEGFHPVMSDMSSDLTSSAKVLSRSSARVTYYFVDFGISSLFTHDSTSKLVLGLDGIEHTVPELSDTIPYDPFKTDIYIIGALFLRNFLNKFSNVQMIEPLVASMTAHDPASRPDAADALRSWRHARSQAYTIQRYWRVRSREESLLGSAFRDVWALVSTV